MLELPHIEACSHCSSSWLKLELAYIGAGSHWSWLTLDRLASPMTSLILFKSWSWRARNHPICRSEIRRWFRGKPPDPLNRYIQFWNQKPTCSKGLEIIPFEDLNFKKMFQLSQSRTFQEKIFHCFTKTWEIPHKKLSCHAGVSFPGLTICWLSISPFNKTIMILNIMTFQLYVLKKMSVR